jgi:hypothetical protein
MFPRPYFGASFFAAPYFATGTVTAAPGSGGGGGSQLAGPIRGSKVDLEAILVQTEEGAALDALKTAWGATDLLILFVNNVTPNKTTTVAELTQPTATWYTATTKTVTYGQTYRLDDGRLAIRTNTIQFDWTAAGCATAELVYGAAIVSAGSAALRAAVRFPAPVTLGDVLASLPVALVVAVDRRG